MSVKKDELVYEKLQQISVSCDDIKRQLMVLNGKVVQNTAFRNQQKIINLVLGAVGVVLLGVIVKTVFGG